MAVALLFIILALFISITPYVPVLSHQSNHNDSSFHLTLVIANKTEGNFTDYAFYVLTDGYMENSTAINVPSNVSVEIQIFNLDPGMDKLLKTTDANLTGSETGHMMVQGYYQPDPLSWAYAENQPVESISHIPANEISHTFTTSTGLNIPIPPLSTVTVNATFSTPGVYSWGCMCDCGMQSMDSSGWMLGSFVVS